MEEAGGPGENHRPVARGQYNNNQGVACMITFLLFIKYMYLKTTEVLNFFENRRNIAGKILRNTENK